MVPPYSAMMRLTPAFSTCSVPVQRVVQPPRCSPGTEPGLGGEADALQPDVVTAAHTHWQLPGGTNIVEQQIARAIRCFGIHATFQLERRLRAERPRVSSADN